MNEKEEFWNEFAEFIAAKSEDISLDNAELIQLFAIYRKDKRTDRINGNGEQATEKQKAFLKRLGVEFDPQLTKEEASELIDRATRRSD